MPVDASSPNTYHFPIVHLLTPKTLKLGRVTFRPKGWLSDLLASDTADRGKNAEIWDDLKRQAEGLIWSTADVEDADSDAARTMVSDAVSALRLYQRARYRYVSLESQTFGLGADIYNGVEDYWRTDGTKLIGAGFQTHGIIGGWEFAEADVDAAAEDPLFQQVDRLLALIPSEATELDRRVLI
jgi:hypothetical protein